MKIRLVASFVCLSVFFLIIEREAVAQWTPTNGPNGAEINCFATHGNFLFAGSKSGAFRSPDYGMTWQELSQGICWDEVRSFVSNGTDLYAGTYSGGVYKSADFGLNWTYCGLTGKHIRALAVCNGFIFAGAMNNTGVYVSSDQGVTWIPSNNGLVNKTIISMAVLGVNVYAGTQGGGVYVSSDTGTTWSPVNTGIGSTNDINALAADGNTLYAGTPLGVYYTNSYGANWTAMNSGLVNQSIFSIAVTSNGLYAGSKTGNGIFYTPGGAGSWGAINNGLNNLTVPALFGMGTFIIAGTQIGVYRKLLNDTMWTNVGLPGMEVSGLTNDGSKLFSVAKTGCVYSSANGGITWQQNVNGISTHESRAVCTANGYIFEGSTYTGVYVSADQGATWSPANNGLGSTNIRTFASKGNKVYAVTTSGIWVTDNNGAGWTALTNGMNKEVLSIVFSGSVMLAGTYQNGVYRSTDDGASWTQVNNGLTDQHVFAMAVMDTAIFAGTNGKGVFFSTDNGDTWIPCSSAIQKNISSLAVFGTTLFAGTDSCRVYMTGDKGLTWQNISTGLDLCPPRPTSCITIKQDTLYAGILSHSVWKRPLADLFTSVDKPFNDDRVSLGHNVPNPFSQTTRIGFTLKEPAWVLLDVYDLYGRHIAALMNKPLPSGNHEVIFDGTGLGAGIYYCRIQAGNTTKAGKMLLVR